MSIPAAMGILGGLTYFKGRFWAPRSPVEDETPESASYRHYTIERIYKEPVLLAQLRKVGPSADGEHTWYQLSGSRYKVTNMQARHIDKLQQKAFIE